MIMQRSNDNLMIMVRGIKKMMGCPTFSTTTTTKGHWLIAFPVFLFQSCLRGEIFLLVCLVADDGADDEEDEWTKWKVMKMPKMKGNFDKIENLIL